MLRKPTLRTTLPQHQAIHQNEYYLPHPHSKSNRYLPTPHTEPEPDPERQKITIKPHRKHSHNAPSLHCVAPITSQSKQINSSPLPKHTLNKKTEGKMRSASNGETSRKPLSKSALKMQMTSRRPPKRITLHIDAASKKQSEKTNLQDINFQSYYSGANEARSVRTLKKPTSAEQSHFNTLLSRCQTVIQQYRCQLQAAKRQNLLLQQENRRLRGDQ